MTFLDPKVGPFGFQNDIIAFAQPKICIEDEIIVFFLVVFVSTDFSYPRQSFFGKKIFLGPV
jgi:hypothetical protein